jgi:hypothetical protein
MIMCFHDRSRPPSLSRSRRPRALALLVLLALVAALCGACAVEPGIEASLRRELPDGSVVVGEFSRQWAEGPVELEADYDPATGKWTVRWKSDVRLDAAQQAAIAQAEAQARFLDQLSALLRVASIVAGAPAPPSSNREIVDPVPGIGPPGE